MQPSSGSNAAVETGRVPKRFLLKKLASSVPEELGGDDHEFSGKVQANWGDLTDDDLLIP